MALATADNYFSWGNGKAVLVGYATIIGIGGLIGNGLVIFLFIYFKSLRTVTNNFIINLAVCDITIAILDLIFSIPSLFASDWIFGKVLGVLYAFSHFLLVSSSMVMLAVIAIDRYHVIARPKLRTRITSIKSLFVIAVVYAYTFAIASPILYAPAGLKVKIYVSGCYIDFTPTSNFGSGSYALVVLVFLYVVPLVTIAFYYCKIFAVLRARRNRCRSAEAEQNRRCYDKKQGGVGNRSTRHRQATKTLRLMAALVGLFLATWTPYMLVILARAFDQKHYFNDLSKEITILVTKSMVVINPVAYALVNHRFQKCVTKLFCCAHIVIGGTTTENSLDLYGGSKSNRASAHDPSKWRLSRPDNQKAAKYVYSESPLVPHTVRVLNIATRSIEIERDETDSIRTASREQYKGLDPIAILERDLEVSITTF